MIKLRSTGDEPLVKKSTTEEELDYIRDQIGAIYCTDMSEDMESSLMHLTLDLERLVKKIGTMAKPFHVPEGYRWCADCVALTPHTPGTNSWNHTCRVCNEEHSDYSDNSCPNCHHTQDDDPGPGEMQVKIHGAGCHCADLDPEDDDHFECRSHAQQILHEFKQEFWDKTRYTASFARTDPYTESLESIGMLDCSCPEVTIYPETTIYNGWEHSVHSMDCMNAMEWGYERRCPICGEVWEVSDENC